MYEIQQWVEYMTFDGESPMAAGTQGGMAVMNGSWKYILALAMRVGLRRIGSEYYADEYRRYALMSRNYGDNRKSTRIACSANNLAFHWTETLMKQAARYMDSLIVALLYDPNRLMGQRFLY